MKRLPSDASDLIAQRESYETELEKIGVLVVDASDVKAIVEQWA
jgi:hypothetical protein